jgi:hypothetical protein
MLYIVHNEPRTYFDVFTLDGNAGVIDKVDGTYRVDTYTDEALGADNLPTPEYYEFAACNTLGTYDDFTTALYTLCKELLPTLMGHTVFVAALRAPEDNWFVTYVQTPDGLKKWYADLASLTDCTRQKECRLVAESYERERDDAGATMEYDRAAALAECYSLL